MKLPKRETIERESGSVINMSKQNLIGILGRRGTGKSYLSEATATLFYECGFTTLDLWASDNWENAFWCIPKLEEYEIDDFIKTPERYNKRTRYPITILCSEALRYDQAKLDKFNGKLFSEKEFYEYYRNQIKYWNCVYPQKKPRSLQGKEWIRFVSLPNPTAKFDSEVNVNIAQIIENTILDCRQSGRILVFNARAFPNETLMFRTLEVLMRNLGPIAMKNFRRLSLEDAGVSSRKEMTKKQKRWDKMVFVIREFGELAPAKLKGDASGESTRVKKSLLSFIRKCRHYQISGIFDYQNASDVESSIRNQIDVWLIKKWTERLGGEQFAFAFQKIEYLRKAVFAKHRNVRQARKIADRMYPPIELLSQSYVYVVKGDDNLKLKKVPEVKTRHKEPYDSFEKFTGIEFWFDKSSQVSTSTANSSTSSKSDEKALYNAIFAMRSVKGSKKRSWEEILVKLSDMQEKNELQWSKPIKEIQKYTLQKQFKRWEKRYEHEDSE